MPHIRFAVLVPAFAVLVVASSLTALSQGLITHKALSLEVAQIIAQGAIDQCRADGYRATVTILDAGGLLKTFVRDDGSSLLASESSTRKAYTSLLFRRTSGEQAKSWAPPKSPPDMSGIGVIAQPGGVPIRAGEEVIGAIGVGGAPGGDKDEVCANAGIAKVADILR